MNLSRQYGDALDQEPFPLPQPGLFADVDAGMGMVALNDEIRALPAAKRFAILGDWQKGIEKERRLVIVSLFREVTDPMEKVDLPQKLTHFREVCSRVGVECPNDLPILLQQV